MYRLLFAKALSKLDAENAHRAAFMLMRIVARIPVISALLRRWLAVRDPRLQVTVFGVRFPGPLGVAAGFDKDARGVEALSMVGFGYAEVGTVTARSQPGNERPRLFRLPTDRAIVNRMGFNNAGAAWAGTRLRRRRGTMNDPRRIPVGVNIGKTKVVDEADRDAVLADHVDSTRLVADVADYLVVNVSSPNTPGLRDLQAVEQLRPLLSSVRTELDRRTTSRVPLLVKIAPDLTDAEIDAVADLALEFGLDGIVATNTTTGRDGLATDSATVRRLGVGGLSGPPLRSRSLEVLRRLRARVGDRLVLVSVGGLETAEDAWERITSGASLLQAYTGFVYAGPAWPGRLQRELARRVSMAGYAAVEEAVGSAIDPAPGAAHDLAAESPTQGTDDPTNR